MPIASGTYKHYENGVLNGITEKWNRTNTSTDIISFNTPTYDLQAQVTVNDSGISAFNYHLADNSLSGTYQRVGQHLLATRNLPSKTQLADKIILPDSAILDLPFLSTKGRTILHVDQHGTVPVFAPHLRSGDRAGDLAKKSVSKLGVETIIINDTSYQAMKYRYGYLYWLDEHGIVLKVEADHYEMVLTEYTRFDSEL